MTRVKRPYRCEATTVGGFVQQLAVQYITHGYWLYVTGYIPERKDPREVDRKLIERYDITASSSERSRRKRAGRANVQYLRHRRFFILCATDGEHSFNKLEEPKDFRRVPLKFYGYSIGYKSGHVSVRIHPESYVRLKAFLLDHATKRDVQWFERVLRRLPYDAYAPVKQQLRDLVRQVRKARVLAGLDPVLQRRVVPEVRRVYSPFGDCDDRESARVA